MKRTFRIPSSVEVTEGIDHRAELKRNQEVHARDNKIRQQLDAGDWPEYLPASAAGESMMKKLVDRGLYELWRIDHAGVTWLRKKADWMSEEYA